MESLPTSGHQWGYTHYPMYARYARTFGLPIVGMTGRFQRSWADFGGLKPADQLQYEVGTILAAGGGVCIGDQLDPSGVLDGAVYRTIGDAYARVQELEPWLTDASPVTDAAIIAAWVDDSSERGRLTRSLSLGVTGAAEILGELAIQYDIIDARRIERGRYRLLVIPDDADLRAEDIEAINQAVEAGAALLTAGAVAFDDSGAPLLGRFPANVVGTVRTVPSYVRVGALAQEVSTDALDSAYAYACYGQAVVLRPSETASAVGTVHEARFNRTWDHFTSHGHAPVSDTEAGPLICTDGAISVIASPIFSAYAEHDYWVDAEIVRRSLENLLPDRVLTHEGPPWVEAALLEQPAALGRAPRSILHLTAFQPRRTASPVPRIDRAHALAGFSVRVATNGPPSAVYLAPSRQPVDFRVANGMTELMLDRVDPSTVVVIEKEAR